MLSRFGVAIALVALAACSSTSASPSTARPASSGASSVSASSPSGSAASPASDRVGVADSWIVDEGPITGGDGGRAGNRMVRPDGTGDHWATPDVPLPAKGWQVHPDWSPDGQRIVFAADDARQDGAAIVTRDLWLSDANGGNLDRVFDCELPCAEADDPAWSPDGRTLAFAVFDAKGDFNVNTRIAVLDLQTRRIRTITRAAGTDNLTGPRWSPDGRTLVFDVQHYTNLGPTGTITGTAIATVPVTDHVAAARVITPWSLGATYPDWHPSQDLVLFYTRVWPDLTGPSNLYTVRSDGSHLTQITRFTKGQTRATQPTFTPDGSHIIFTAVEGDDFGNPTMAVIALDGSGLTSATSSGPMFGTHPRLRPTVK